MSGYNRIILIGNLTRDPEVRYTPQGVAVCDLRLAITTRRGNTRDGGERREETLFIDATVWERNAEIAQQYLSKGKPVLVEGRLIEDSWDDKTTGEKRSKMKVTVDRMQFLPRNDAHGGGAADAGAADAPAFRSAPGGYAPRAPSSPPGGGPPPRKDAAFGDGPDAGHADIADDIPF